MLDPNPETRLTAAGVVAHPWFRRGLDRGLAGLNSRLILAQAGLTAEEVPSGCMNSAEVRNVTSPLQPTRPAQSAGVSGGPHCWSRRSLWADPICNVFAYESTALCSCGTWPPSPQYSLCWIRTNP